MKLVRNNDVLVVEISTKDFGNVKVYLQDSTNKIGNGYYVTATKNKKHLAGFVDVCGQEIIPLQEMELDELFYTSDYENICFGFKIANTEILKYFHVKKQQTGTYQVVFETNPFDPVPIVIAQVKEDYDFWVLKKEISDSEYAVYSPKEGRILTNFFDEISFDLEPNPNNHYIYFCKYIYSDIKIDDETTRRIIHTSVCGFFDDEGNFSSQIFETEAKLLYNSYVLGNNSLSKEFKRFLVNKEREYLDRYNNAEGIIDNTINYLFNNFNLSEIPQNKSLKPAKIIEFKKKDINE